MSTLQMTGAAVPAAHREKAGPGLLTRLFDRWSRYQARVAQSYVDQYLQRLGDQQLKEMGYGVPEIARIRAANGNAPQYWL